MDYTDVARNGDTSPPSIRGINEERSEPEMQLPPMLPDLGGRFSNGLSPLSAKVYFSWEEQINSLAGDMPSSPPPSSPPQRDRSTYNELAFNCPYNSHIWLRRHTPPSSPPLAPSFNHLSLTNSHEEHLPASDALQDVASELSDINDRGSHESATYWNQVNMQSIDLGSHRYRLLIQKVKKTFGFDVKPWQASAMLDSLEDQKDVFVIAGTGSGKSLVYQALPCLRPGAIVLVISPTLALMDDQVKHLLKLGVSATALTSEAVATDPKLWKSVEAGNFSIVLASPEILLKDGSHFWQVTVRNKRSQFCKNLAAIVVDECHLVWGWREFRKNGSYPQDYLGIGTLKSHFRKLPMIALSATVTPNVMQFVINSLGLRKGMQLYKMSIDRQNIAQIVAQIPASLPGISAYSPLQFLIPRLSSALWFIPKTMIFVDNIEEAQRITIYLRAQLAPSIRRLGPVAIRPFHASLEASTRVDFLSTFRMGDTRILVCTDAAGMGVDIPDVQVVVQWKLAEHLTLAALWQRIGRAGRNPDLLAVAVVFVESKHLLPEVITEGDFVGYTEGVQGDNDDNRMRTRAFVQKLYMGGQQRARVRVPSPYHRVDPPVLWYINTRGCRCRAILAAFVDTAAYYGERPLNCCDNSMFQNSTGSVPEFIRNRVDIRQSIRYLDTLEAQEAEVERVLELERGATMRNRVITKGYQTLLVRKALDAWARSNWGSAHRMFFPLRWREKLANHAARIDTPEDIQMEIGAEIHVPTSIIAPFVGALINLIQDSAAGSAPEASTRGLEVIPNPILVQPGSMAPTLSGPEDQLQDPRSAPSPTHAEAPINPPSTLLALATTVRPRLISRPLASRVPLLLTPVPVTSTPSPLPALPFMQLTSSAGVSASPLSPTSLPARPLIPAALSAATSAHPALLPRPPARPLISTALSVVASAHPALPPRSPAHPLIPTALPAQSPAHPLIPTALPPQSPAHPLIPTALPPQSPAHPLVSTALPPVVSAYRALPTTPIRFQSILSNSSNTVVEPPSQGTASHPIDPIKSNMAPPVKEEDDTQTQPAYTVPPGIDSEHYRRARMAVLAMMAQPLAGTPSPASPQLSATSSRKRRGGAVRQGSGKRIKEEPVSSQRQQPLEEGEPSGATSRGEGSPDGLLQKAQKKVERAAKKQQAARTKAALSQSQEKQKPRGGRKSEDL